MPKTDRISSVMIEKTETTYVFTHAYTHTQTYRKSPKKFAHITKAMSGSNSRTQIPATINAATINV